MTTRTRSTFTNPLFESFSAIGTDGRYEIVNGQKRERWNNYTLSYLREVRTPGRTPMYIGDQWWDCSVNAGSILTANDELSLQGRLIEAVKGHQFNLAVSAAQGKQTVDMVVNAVHSIGGAIRDLKRGKFESAARRFGVKQRPSKLSEKDVAGRWLELQYGWLPLISDVYEASKAYESVTNKIRKNRVSVSLSREGIKDTSASSSNYSCKGMVDERWRLIYEMSEQLSTARSLGLTDPASVVWELIPYSFVVDWFLPIGSYLENLNTIPKLQGRFMTIKVRRFNGSALNVNKAVTWTKLPTTQNSQYYLTRTVSTSLSVPKPAFVSLPDAMSPSRIWNALALVTQRLR